MFLLKALQIYALITYVLLLLRIEKLLIVVDIHHFKTMYGTIILIILLFISVCNINLVNVSLINTNSTVDSEESANAEINLTFKDTKLQDSYSSMVTIFSSTLGGSDDDSLSFALSDNEGNTYISGTTHSTDFLTKNAFDDTYNGGLDDIFLAKIGFEEMFMSAVTPHHMIFLLLTLSKIPLEIM